MNNKLLLRKLTQCYSWWDWSQVGLDVQAPMASLSWVVNRVQPYLFSIPGFAKPQHSCHHCQLLLCPWKPLERTPSDVWRMKDSASLKVHQSGVTWAALESPCQAGQSGRASVPVSCSCCQGGRKNGGQSGPAREEGWSRLFLSGTVLREAAAAMQFWLYFRAARPPGWTYHGATAVRTCCLLSYLWPWGCLNTSGPATEKGGRHTSDHQSQSRWVCACGRWACALRNKPVTSAFSLLWGLAFFRSRAWFWRSQPSSI